MLRDYEPGDWTTDYFTLNTDKTGNVQTNGELSFPCCCCTHGEKDQNDDPCYHCGHNVNSVCAGRKGVGAELKPSYWRQAVKNCATAGQKREQDEMPLFATPPKEEEMD